MRLHEVYESGGAIALKEELTNGADANELDLFGTPLLCAVSAIGDIEAIRALVVSGANIEGSGVSGWTPLIFAANAGNEEAVHVLLELGANPNPKTIEGYTAAGRCPGQQTSLYKFLEKQMSTI